MATMTGTSSSDTLYGTSGSDKINAGDGNDVLYYNLALNSQGTSDIYTGGSGIDMVVLQFTYDQWNSAINQQQLTNYFNWLGNVKKNSTGEISNGQASDFTFTFGSSTLKIQMMEQLGVMVDGRWLGGELSVYQRSGPVAHDDTATIEEDPRQPREQNDGMPDDSGTDVADQAENSIQINVLSNPSRPEESDSVPDGVKNLEVIGNGPAHGTVYIVKDSQNTPENPNTWVFRYVANSADFQYLKNGETATDQFQYRVTDINGMSSTATVTITVAGRDDEAKIGEPSLTALTEDQHVDSAGFLNVAGTISVTDPDHDQNGFNTSVTTSPANKGSLTLQADGAYTYSIENSKVQSLGEGEIWTDTFTIYSLDGASKEIAFVTTGVDDPTIISGSLSGTVMEKGSNYAGEFMANGILFATDADGPQVDFIAAEAAGNYGSFALNENGAWVYFLDNSIPAVNALNVNSTPLTDIFTIKTEDGVSQNITIYIQGADDASVIGDPQNNQLTEDGEVNSSGKIVRQGYLPISDVDNQIVNGFLQGAYANSTNIGSTSFDEGGFYYYSVENENIQYLRQGQQHTDYFRVIAVDGTEKTISFTITGVNDAAQIGNLQNNQLTEDLDPDANNMLSLAGKLTISDADAGEAMFKTTVQSAAGNLGLLSLSSDGNYSYIIDNSKVQSLNTGQSHEDKFTISSVDGTTKELKFVTAGANEVLPPVAQTDVVWVSTNTIVTIPVSALLANDINPNGGNLKILSIYDVDSKFSSESLSADGTEIIFSSNGLTSGYASAPASYTMSYKLANESGLTTDGFMTVRIAPLIIDPSGNLLSDIDDMSGEYFYLDMNFPDVTDFAITIIASGNGPSTLIGSECQDFIYGGLYIDQIYGGNNDDDLNGNAGSDEIFGGQGDDTVDGGAGNDLIYAGYGDDIVFGNRFDQNLLLENDNDTIYGEEGDDNLYGGIGLDSIYGGAGNDRIRGGENNDYLDGGTGDDIFYFNTELILNTDIIYGFEGIDSSGSNHDLICFSALFGFTENNQSIGDIFAKLEFKGDEVTVGDQIRLIYDQQKHMLYFDPDGGDLEFREPIINLVGLIGSFDSSCISIDLF